MSNYKCKQCGYIYDHTKGDPEHEIGVGTYFSGLPETWKCPVCKAEIGEFENVAENITEIKNQEQENIEPKEEKSVLAPRICNSCGAEFLDDGIFCGECGAEYKDPKEIAIAIAKEKEIEIAKAKSREKEMEIAKAKEMEKEIAIAKVKAMEKEIEIAKAKAKEIEKEIEIANANVKEIEKESRICSNCGTEVQVGSGFCGKCGTPYQKPQEKKPRLCGKCGTEVPEGLNFCGKCGTPYVALAVPVQQNTIKHCPKCGNELASNETFCGKCGTGMQAQKQIEPSQFFNNDTYFIDQKAEALQVINIYKIYDSDGIQLGSVKEAMSTTQKVASFTKFGAALPFTFDIMDINDNIIANISRGWALVPAPIKLVDKNNKLIVTFKSKIKFREIVFNVFNPNEAQIATISGKFKDFNLSVNDNDGKQMGTITKKFNGVLNALFRGEDKYVVSINPDVIEESMKIFMIAAAVITDKVFSN